MTNTKTTTLSAILIFFVCVAAYLSSANPTHSGDTIPNTLFGFNILQNQRLDFDNFRGTYLDTQSSYWFLRSVSGHLSSAYPLGTSVIASPITVCYWFYLMLAHPGFVITSPNFELFRIAYEQVAAACITSLSAVIFFFLSRARFKQTASVITTFVYAFATSNWAISSQALWQHGSSNLCILVIALCVSRANSRSVLAHRAAWLIIAGLFCGLLPIIRPSNIIFSFVTAIYCLTIYRKQSAWLLLGSCSVLPGVTFNVFYFHNLLGGYQSLFTPDIFSLSRFQQGFAGCLFSPGRGLFIYTPVLLFAFAGLSKLLISLKTTRDSLTANKVDQFILFLTGASLAYCSIFFFYKVWWGGACYGPRFMTEAMPMLVFLINYYLDDNFKPASLARRITLSAFFILTILSTLIQMIGVFGTGAQLWNTIPLNVDYYPERLWQIHDSPIERNFNSFTRRSTMRSFKKVLGIASENAKFDGTIQGKVLSVTAAGAPLIDESKVWTGSIKLLKFQVLNLSSIRWNGYESGSDALETFLYLHVDFLDQNGIPVPHSGANLPIAGSPSGGSQTFAEGELKFPSKAGDYTMMSRLQWYYVPQKLNQTIPLRTRIHVLVRPAFF